MENSLARARAQVSRLYFTFHPDSPQWRVLTSFLNAWAPLCEKDRGGAEETGDETQLHKP